MRGAFCLKILSLDGNLQFISPEGIALLEAGSSECLTGRNYIEMWPAHWRAAVVDALRDAAEGKIATLEGYCPTFKGTPKWWESSFYLVRGEATEPHIIGISHDITAQRLSRLQHEIGHAGGDWAETAG